MNPLLLFVHGWGFDSRFWDALRGVLIDIDSAAWDLGFFGPASQPVPPAGRSVIAIGHSFGVLWLLKHRPFPWQALIAINGFTRFTRSTNFPEGIEPRWLTRMQAGLAEDPGRVVDAFRRRCGAAPIVTPIADDGPLQVGLDGLAHWDERLDAGQAGGIDLALCGKADPVVAVTMSQRCFAEPTLRWHAGGHLLPQQDPDWCARHIRTVWERAA
jgi:pimeloyl-ACP methyl ester carboxylesterase